MTSVPLNWLETVPRADLCDRDFLHSSWQSMLWTLIWAFLLLTQLIRLRSTLQLFSSRVDVRDAPHSTWNVARSRLHSQNISIRYRLGKNVNTLSVRMESPERSVHPRVFIKEGNGFKQRRFWCLWWLSFPSKSSFVGVRQKKRYSLQETLDSTLYIATSYGRPLWFVDLCACLSEFVIVWICPLGQPLQTMFVYCEIRSSPNKRMRVSCPGHVSSRA